MRRPIVLATLLVGLLAAPAAARADEVFVAPNGAGSTCSEAAPCSLETGIDGIVDGTDTLHVGSGDYLTPLTENKSLLGAVVGQPAGGVRPTIHLQDANLTFTNGASNLDVRGTSVDPLVIVSGASADHLDVRDTDANAFSACFVDAGTLSNSLCVANGTTSGSGLAMSDSELFSVTAVSSTDNGIECTGGDCALTNVIASGNAGASDLVADVGSNIATTTSAWTKKAGTVTGTALTKPTLDAAFKPIAGSATIDAGTAGTGTTGLDLDFNLASLGAKPDVGAFEHVLTKPGVGTGSTSGLTDSAVTLTATVTTNGGGTTWTWTPIAGGGPAVPGKGFAAGNAATRDATLSLSGLQPGTAYSYKLTATSDAGSTEQTISFTTATRAAVVTTTDAIGVGTTTATLTGTVDTGGNPGTVHFEYTPAGGATVSTPEGATTPPITAAVSGLPAGTDVSYELVFTPTGGGAAVRGGAKTFKTAAASTGGGGTPGGGTPGGGTPGGGGTVTPTPTVTTTPTTTPTTTKLKVTAPSKSAATKLLSKGTAVKVKVTCPTACSTKVKGSVKAGKTTLGKLAVPAKALKIAAGGSGTMSVKASKALRKTVKAYKRKHKKARLTVVLTVTTTPAGAKATTKTLKVQVG